MGFCILQRKHFNCIRYTVSKNQGEKHGKKTGSQKTVMKTESIKASMLYDFVICPHRVTMDLPGNREEKDPISPFVQLLWERGNAFEKAVIEKLKIPFVNLRIVPDPERERFTREAMDAVEGLIYGGRIRSGDLLGEPDLLRKQSNGYVAGDIKSGAGLEGASEDTDGKPKEHYAVQLALYTEILGFPMRRKAFGEVSTFNKGDLAKETEPRQKRFTFL